MRSTDSRTRIARCVLTAVVALLCFAAAPTPAQAEGAYTLSAGARGTSVIISNKSFPLVQSLQLNTPTAQAMLNSRGQGSSYSASPDPGLDAAQLPATGSAQMCAILQAYGIDLPGCSTIAPLVPAYPYAYAQTGDPPQDRSFAGAHLHAEASENSSKAQTTVGAPGVASMISTALAAARPDGSTVSTATTSVDSLELGSAVRLSGIASTATARRDASGKLALSSSFRIGQLLVNGLEVGYSDGAFVILGRAVPVAIPAQQVLDALKAVGVTATFLPRTKSDKGIVSEGLMLSYTAPGAPGGVLPAVPLPLPIGVGVPSTPTTVTYVLGRAEVTSTNRAIGGFGDGGLIGGGLPGLSSGAAQPLAPGSAATGGPAALPGALPVLGATSDAGQGPQVAGPATGTAQAAQSSALTSDGAGIYLAFVVLALAAFGGASAIRFLGVRLSWTS